MMAYRVYIRQKRLGGCHPLSLVYDASKLSTVHVVKSPVLGLQTAPENSEFAPLMPYHVAVWKLQPCKHLN